jgi:hypothetical protein
MLRKWPKDNKKVMGIRRSQEGGLEGYGKLRERGRERERDIQTDTQKEGKYLKWENDLLIK